MKKKFILDMSLNMVATFVPICILQFFILPFTATIIPIDQYGVMTTIIALMTMVSHTMGSTLNNIRLLHDEKYRELNVHGDFNILIILSAIVNGIIMSIGTFYYEGELNSASIVLVVLATVINLLREYFLVGFRLKLNYKGILINNIILVLGYGLGTGIFLLTDMWQYIYIFGNMFSLIYILRITKMHQESWEKTILFKQTSIKSLILLVAGVLSNILNYVDRLIIFPLFGAEMVSIYYISTLLGKIISLGIGPISSVILSYISSLKKPPKNGFRTAFLSSVLLGMGGYIICMVISGPILNVLYPEWAEQALKYIPITTLTAIITMLCSTINPFILKFCNIGWQIGINSICISIYAILTVSLVVKYGVMGFCVGTLLTNSIKLIAMLMIYILFSKKIFIRGEENEKEIIKKDM